MDGDDATQALHAFSAIDMRVGRVIKVELNEKARKPAYKLWIDFGPELGEKTSSAQITDLYAPDDLIGRLVIGAVNLGSRRVAGFKSDVLVLGAPDDSGRVVLLGADQEIAPGSKVF